MSTSTPSSSGSRETRSSENQKPDTVKKDSNGDVGPDLKSDSDPSASQSPVSRIDETRIDPARNDPARMNPASCDDSEMFLDHARQERCGFPEAIFGEGKSVEQLLKIADQQLDSGTSVFVTRISSEGAQALGQNFHGRHNEVARTFFVPATGPKQLAQPISQQATSLKGFVPVLAAGTTDLPIVEEAIETLNWMGIPTRRVMDVGVAGPHRLPEKLGLIQGADAIVVVAGMEGALPSVVAGYVDCPVIAIPTSVGYGANLGGISALLSMLNSCAPNVSVVNIDAGFKGAYVAGLISSRMHRPTEE